MKASQEKINFLKDRAKKLNNLKELRKIFTGIEFKIPRLYIIRAKVIKHNDYFDYNKFYYAYEEDIGYGLSWGFSEKISDATFYLNPWLNRDLLDLKRNENRFPLFDFEIIEFIGIVKETIKIEK